MKKFAGLLTITSLAFTLVSCAGPDLRPGFRAESPVLERQWTISTRTRETLAGERGVEFSNPVLWENTLLFGTSEAGLVALYPALGGQFRWVLPIPGGITSELLRNEGDVYFGGADGFVYAVNGETGRVLWRYDVRNPKISRPTLHGGRLYITTTDDIVYALDAGTGRWLWQYKRKSGTPASIHGASSPWINGTQVLAGMSDGYLIVLNSEDGRLIREKRLASRSKFTDIDASVVTDGQSLFVPSYDGSLSALNRDTLETLWSYEAGGSRSIAVDGDRLILASSDGAIHLLQKSSGKLLWKFDLDGGSPTAPLITDRYVLVGSSHQYLYAIDKASGRLLDRWNAGYGSGFSGGMAYDSAKKVLYAVSGGANLYSFKIR